MSPKVPLAVALAGNPNTGKTTLFNAWTGARAHVGNYPGVTVERRESQHTCKNGQVWTIHDLPGTYSLTAHSPEEEIAHHALTGRLAGLQADVVVVVLDAGNLARNLYLLLQILAYRLPVVAALNLVDEAEREGVLVDAQRLGQHLGIAVIPTVARSGQGLQALEDAVAAAAQAPPPAGRTPVPWSAMLAAKLNLAQTKLPAGATLAEADWWLCADPQALQPDDAALALAVQSAVSDPHVANQLAEERYRFIDQLTKTVVSRRPVPRSQTQRMDAVLLHPFWGVALFLLAVTILFQAVFAWAGPLMDAVDAAMGLLGDGISAVVPAGLLREVLVDGVVGGIGATLVFLPQILILFFGLSLLEDSGYLARAAFLVDRVMQLVGLPGKSFVPLLSSFACNVPGILAARTLADPRDRLLTILTAPLMSCAARLPVYTMVTASVFADWPPLWGGLLVAGMYGLGLVLALLTALVLRRTSLKGHGSTLLLELPPYRWPRPGNVVRVLGERAWQFTTQTGAVIVGLSIVLWALLAFPKTELPASLAAAATAGATAGQDGDLVAAQEAAVAAAAEQHQLQQSVAGRMGQAIEPAIAPLGFDWRIGIGLIGSLAAREVLVPVMGQVMGKGAGLDAEEAAASIGDSLRAKGALTPLKGLSLMVFFAIAMQCLSTVAAIRRETGGWKWAAFSLFYLNGLAWVASFVVYQGGRLLGYS
jgi:ferrous iron transport protein B